MMPDGQIADWDIIEGCAVVAVVAVTDTGRVILARMFRPGPGRILLELPGGGVEPGEDIEAAACRELLEETGYIPGNVKLVGQTWLASFSTHQKFAVLATECRRAPEPADRSDPLEFIEPALLAMDDFRRHASTGQLTDADVAFMCLNYLDQQGSGSGNPRSA
jgi:ADP-ribose pyrophosphatase